MKKKIEVRKQKDGSKEGEGIKEVKKGGEKSQKLRIQARIFKIRGGGEVVWTDGWTYIRTEQTSICDVLSRCPKRAQNLPRGPPLVYFAIEF
jgi:hypothetical protein